MDMGVVLLVAWALMNAAFAVAMYVSVIMLDQMHQDSAHACTKAVHTHQDSANAKGTP